MTNGEVLINLIKETFPDLVKEIEDDSKHLIDLDDINVCDFINCDGLYCDVCKIDQGGLSCRGTWSANEYHGTVVSSNSTTAIASGDISW